MRKSALALGCCLSAGVQANPVVELHPVVVTASRSEQVVAQAPASVTVISAEQIKASGASNLLEAVRTVPGLTLNGRQVGGRKTLSIRGAEDRHTLVLIDGKRISSTDDTIGHSDYQYGWVAIDQIERIEVVRGPMSALYGSEAVGGVINIITRKSANEWGGGFSVRGDVARGDGGNGHRLAVHAGGPLGDMFDLAVGAEQLRFAPVNSRDDKRVSAIEGRLRESANMRLGFTPLAGQRIQLDVQQGDETLKRKQDSRGGPPYYVDTYELERRQHSLGWSGDWSGITSELRYSEASFEVNNKRSNGVTPTRRQRLEDKIWDGNLSFALGARHALTLGSEHRNERLENAGLRGGSDSVDHQAFYLQDEFELADAWTLTFGARLDHHGIFGNETSPRAYLVWQATPALTVKGGYGEAFRAPTLKQISPAYEGAEGPHTFYGNADIRPETSRSWELGVDWRDPQRAYSATVFHNEIKDLIYTKLIDRVGVRGIYQYHNIARARMRGAEFAVAQPLTQQFDLLLNLTWLDARDRDSSKRLSGRPQWVMTPMLQWQGERLSAQLEWQFTGRQWLEDENARLVRVPGYSLVNLSANYALDKRFTLRAGVSNLGDLKLEDKSELFGYVEARRTAWLALEGRF